MNLSAAKINRNLNLFIFFWESPCSCIEKFISRVYESVSSFIFLLDSLWDFLFDLSITTFTIIITSHYNIIRKRKQKNPLPTERNELYCNH